MNTRLLWMTLLVAACSMGKGGKEKLDENLIRKVERGTLIDEVSESGKITPRFDVDIKSKVSGEVGEVDVEEGQTVSKGDILYTIIDTEYARDVSLQRIELEKAELYLANAEVECHRKELALQSRGVSEAEYDMAKREVEMAKIAVESAKVQLQAARDRFDYCRISAPIDGVIIRRNVEQGEVVTAGVTATVNGEPQLTIAQMDRLLLEIDLNQVDVARVKVGQTARILLDAYPGEEVPGTVTQIAASGHTDTTRGIDVFTVKVEVDPAQSKVEIKPGMTAEVRIHVGEYPDVVKLPTESVFEEEGKSWVYAIKEENGKKTKDKVELEVGVRTNREVEVKGGVTEGQEYYAEAKVKDMSEKID